MNVKDLIGNHPGLGEILEPWLVIGFLVLFFILLVSIYAKTKPSNQKEKSSALIRQIVATSFALLLTTQVAIGVLWIKQNSEERAFVDALKTAATVDIQENFIVDEINITETEYREGYFTAIAEMYTAPYTEEMKFKYSHNHELLIPFAMEELPDHVFVKQDSELEEILNTDGQYEMNIIQHTIDDSLALKSPFYASTLAFALLLLTTLISIGFLVAVVYNDKKNVKYATGGVVSGIISIALFFLFSLIPSGSLFNHDIRQVTLYNIKENYGLDHVKAKSFDYVLDENVIETEVEATVDENTVTATFTYDERAGHMIQDRQASEEVLEPVEGSWLEQWLTERHKALVGED